MRTLCESTLASDAEQALHELLLGHLEAEHEHPLVVVDPGVLGDVQREGRLAHTGRPAMMMKSRRLEPEVISVELVEAGGERR